MGNKRYDRRVIRRREAEERQAKHDALVRDKAAALLKQSTANKTDESRDKS